jgi:beta-lactamase regulating signal transducer with metallopeptidase domain
MAIFPKIHPRYKIALYSLIIIKPFIRLLLGTPLVTKSINNYSNHPARGLFIYIPDPNQILPFRDLVEQIKFFDISYFIDDIFMLSLIISIIIFIFFIYRWISTYFFYKQLSKENEVDIDKNKELYEFIKNTCAKLKIKKIRLLESKKIISPFTVGVINPTIIFPRSVLSNLSKNEIQQVTLHEIMHIKRRDSIKKWFLTIIGDLLFFAPPVYLARLKINDYIEQDCDFKTITFNNNPKDLAQGIFKIATLMKKNGIQKTNPIVISNMFLFYGSNLKSRIISFTSRKTFITKTWVTIIFYILYILSLICQISIAFTLNGKPIIL